MKKETLDHPFQPIYDFNASILILGTFPSVKSREKDFYYGHPQNRFWRLLPLIFGEAPPESVEEKKRFLVKNHIALWDVLAGCDIQGSSDSSISAPRANDLTTILSVAKIKKIYTNGKKAKELYDKYIFPITGIEAISLPSTSPANGQYSMDRLVGSWGIIKETESLQP